MGLKMIKMINMIYKIVHYLILNSIVGLVMSLLAYVVVGNVEFPILLYLMYFVGGVLVE